MQLGCLIFAKRIYVTKSIDTYDLNDWKFLVESECWRLSDGLGDMVGKWPNLVLETN